MLLQRNKEHVHCDVKFEIGDMLALGPEKLEVSIFEKFIREGK